MAEAGDVLLPASPPTGEQMLEWDRATVDRLLTLARWVVAAIALAALIIGIIALVKISSAPDAVAAYVQSVSDAILVGIQQSFVNVTIAIAVQQAQIDYLLERAQTCQCTPVANSTAGSTTQPPSSTAAYPTVTPPPPTLTLANNPQARGALDALKQRVESALRGRRVL